MSGLAQLLKTIAKFGGQAPKVPLPRVNPKKATRLIDNVLSDPKKADVAEDLAIRLDGMTPAERQQALQTVTRNIEAPNTSRSVISENPVTELERLLAERSLGTGKKFNTKTGQVITPKDLKQTVTPGQVKGARATPPDIPENRRKNLSVDDPTITQDVAQTKGQTPREEIRGRSPSIDNRQTIDAQTLNAQLEEAMKTGNISELGQLLLEHTLDVRNVNINALREMLMDPRPGNALERLSDLLRNK